MKGMAKALAWFTSGSLFGTLTQVVKGKLGAVILGAEGVGILNQLTGAWSMVNSISGLSLFNGVIQKIAKANSDGDQNALLTQLSTSLIFLTGFSCLTSLLAIIFSPYISDLIFDDNGTRYLLVAVVMISVPFSVVAQTYSSVLKGCKLVRPIVIAQVLSDFVGLILFVVLIMKFSLLGAAAGFSALQVAKLVFQIWTIQRNAGRHLIFPRTSLFSWGAVRGNIGFGINGLVLSVLSLGTVLVVSRWIISDIGFEANGIYSVAWKVASLYFGALYAAAGGYYLPSLVECIDNSELSAKISETLNLYMFLLPPLIIGITIGGELLLTILFSREFVAAALLLALMLPGDLFRVSSETISLAFLARSKLLIYTGAYAVWASLFLLFAWILLPLMGLLGVATAYFASHLTNFLITFIVAHRLLGFKMSQPCLQALMIGLGVVILAAFVAFNFSDNLSRFSLGLILLIIWGAVSWRDKSFRMLANAAISKVFSK